MTRSQTSRIDSAQIPNHAERIFMGLIREGMMSYYVGRASQLTEDELRSVFAVAQAALRHADHPINDAAVKAAAAAMEEATATPAKVTKRRKAPAKKTKRGAKKQR